MVKKVTGKFAAEEDGAVTVDWVVLTAAIVSLTIGAFTLMRPQTLVTAGSQMGDTASSATERGRAAMVAAEAEVPEAPPAGEQP